MPPYWQKDVAHYGFISSIIKWIASSFGNGDENSYENDEFSSPGNLVFSPLPENPILLGHTFQVMEQKLNFLRW